MNNEKRNIIYVLILNIGTSIFCFILAIYHILVTHNINWVIIEIVLTLLNIICSYINFERLKDLDK